MEIKETIMDKYSLGIVFAAIVVASTISTIVTSFIIAHGVFDDDGEKTPRIDDDLLQPGFNDLADTPIGYVPVGKYPVPHLHLVPEPTGLPEYQPEYELDTDKPSEIIAIDNTEAHDEVFDLAFHLNNQDMP